MSQTVLVIDDDLDVLDAMHVILSLEGYDVRCAHDGFEALAMLAEGLAPSLVITDMMMPDLTGSDVLTSMREEPDFRNIPVVLTTAAAELATPKGVTTLYKPFSVEELLAVVAAHLGALAMDGRVTLSPDVPVEKVSAA